MSETLTVHQALCELKIIDDRINKAIKEEPNFVIPVKKGTEKINGRPVQEFSNRIQASYDKAIALIKRRNAIKSAVVLSNATTKIIVGGNEFTVAEAIEFKNHGLDFDRLLLNTLVTQSKAAKAVLNSYSGEAVEKKAESFIQNILSSQGKGDKGLFTVEDIESMRERYIDNNSYTLLDPLKVDVLIEELHDRITQFTVDVDSALSVSNATTTITFNY